VDRLALFGELRHVLDLGEERVDQLIMEPASTFHCVLHAETLLRHEGGDVVMRLVPRPTLPVAKVSVPGAPGVAGEDSLSVERVDVVGDDDHVGGQVLEPFDDGVVQNVVGQVEMDQVDWVAGLSPTRVPAED